MNNKIINKLIFIISGLALIASILLVAYDIWQKDICPLLFGLPACYIVLGLFIIMFISTLVFHKKIISNILFFLGIIPNIVITVWFSYNRIVGNAECPEFLDIPLCYVNFIVLIMLLILKIVELQKN